MADSSSEDRKCNWIKLCCSFLGFHWRAIFSILWPILSLAVFTHGYDKIIRVAYFILIIIGYWLTECIPLYMTAWLPIFLCPIMQLASSAQIVQAYINQTNWFAFTYILFAIFVEHSGLHLRLALCLMLLLGCSPRRVHFGISMISMILSMWFMNTLVAAVMCPIIMSILKEFELQGIMTVNEPPDPAAGPNAEVRPTKMTKAYFFTMVFGSTIGSIGTIASSGTFSGFKVTWQNTFPEGEKLYYFPWMLFNVPGMFAMGLLSWFSLQITCMGMFQTTSEEYEICVKGAETKDATRNIIRTKYNDLGRINFSEIVVFILFLIVHIVWQLDCWQIKENLNRRFYFFTIADPSVFLFVFFALMFLLPASCSCVNFCSRDRNVRPFQPSPGVLTWDAAEKMFPLGVFFLYGSSNALFYVIQTNGGLKIVTDQLNRLNVLDPSWVVVISSFISSVLTELFNNAYAFKFVHHPLIYMAIDMKVHPLRYTIPAAICCHFAFLLPTGEPSKALILAYTKIPMNELIKHGILTKLITWLLTVIICHTYALLFFDLLNCPSYIEC